VLLGQSANMFVCPLSSPWCLDYGSATLASLPDLLLGELLSVLNAAARLVFSGRKYDHVTSLLRDLHWLPFAERITFRLAALAYRCQYGLASSFICQLIHSASWMLILVGDFDQHRRQCASFHARDSRQLVSELSQLPLDALWTIYHALSLQRPLCLLSERNSKPNIFSRLFAITVYMRMHVLFYMPLIYVYFLFKHLCGPPCLHRALAAKFSSCHVNLFVD